MHPPQLFALRSVKRMVSALWKKSTRTVVCLLILSKLVCFGEQ